MAFLQNQGIGAVRAPLPPLATRPYDLRIDESRRIVRSEAHGDWTVVQTEDYVAELAELIAECRRRFGRARVLADWRDSPVRSAAVADVLGRANSSLYDDYDKLALVVGSSLAKGQMRRTFTHAGSQAFLSDTAAELWLTAWP